MLHEKRPWLDEFITFYYMQQAKAGYRDRMWHWLLELFNNKLSIIMCLDFINK